MELLRDYLKRAKDDFNGNPKELDKFINKIDAFVHAPFTEKDAIRMLPFSENTALVSFINHKLKDYFIDCNEFRADEQGVKNYDKD